MNATGPRTDEGKRRSSLNALKHGLTGHTMIIAEDQIDAYKAHCQGYFDYYKPVGHPEKMLVQSIADD